MSIFSDMIKKIMEVFMDDISVYGNIFSECLKNHHASDYAIGAVLGQTKDKKHHAIAYASKTLNSAQLNYATTKIELLAVVFAIDKFRSYLVKAKVIVFTYHASLKYLLTKKDANPRLI
jgi:hypothetical protein